MKELNAVQISILRSAMSQKIAGYDACIFHAKNDLQNPDAIDIEFHQQRLARLQTEREEACKVAELL